jgi:DnaJ-class molecular chaperone
MHFKRLIQFSDHILDLAASPDHYAILGVSEQASQAEIKEAYHRKILAAHPDRTRSTSSTAADLNEAYACLNDSETRSAYDISRKRAQSKAVHSES